MATDDFFNAEEISDIQKFVTNTLVGRDVSLSLYNRLIARGVINSATTMASLTTPEYANLMMALFNTMSLSLPNTGPGSRFGLNLVGDFDVLHSFGNNRGVSAWLEEYPHMAAALTAKDVDTLKKQSAKLRRWLNTQRKTLIEHWDLPDGELPEPPKKNKRTPPTKTSVAAAIEADLAKMPSSERSRIDKLWAEGIFLFCLFLPAYC